MNLLRSMTLGLLLTLAVRAADAPVQEIPDEIVRKVDPSVVAIQHERALGSGFIISADGYILSNGHVVQGNDEEDPTQPAKAITVILSNEQKYPARVLGYSMDPDVALLKIDPSQPLQPVEFADSRNVQIGQRVFAVGTPVGLKRTFTGGLLSNVDRTDLGTETKVFQTDAAINPGNSGGPLFDQQGRVLGINTYGAQGNNNLGFTIPAHVALVLKEHFLRHGRFVRSVAPYFTTSELYDELAQALSVSNGLLITYVLPGTPAYDAGLRDGDVIVELDGAPCGARTVAELLDIEWAFMTRPVGSTATVTVVSTSDRKRRAIPLTLEAMERLPRMGRHAGEIVEARYQSLGLGVRELAVVQRISQNLPDVKGVFVSTVSKNGEAAEAGLQANDIITAVGGRPTPDERSFREAMELQLGSRSKYIECSVQRRNQTFETALAPHYLIRGSRVALVLPPGEPEYVDLIRRELVANGADVRLYSVDGRPFSAPAANPVPSTPIEMLDANATDVLIIAGGVGGHALKDHAELKQRIRQLAKSEKTLAAAGSSGLCLIDTEAPLKGRKVTVPKEDSSDAIARGANYTGRDVESDSRTVTTTAFDRETVRRFVQDVVRVERERR